MYKIKKIYFPITRNELSLVLKQDWNKSMFESLQSVKNSIWK